MNNLKTKTLKNIGFNAFSNATKFVLTAGAGIILAQRLSPSDYGIVGFAMIFINFLSGFSDLGISAAVIQRDKLEDLGLYTGFVTKFILGLAVFGFVIVLSPYAKLLFNNSDIENVMKVLSINFIINTFGFLPTCLLTRDLNYKKLIIPQLLSVIVSSGLSIILVLTGFGYWSIVWSNVASVVCSVFTLNIILPVKYKFMFDKKLFRDFTRFGGNIFLSGLIICLILNADNFAIGTLIGSAELGLYTIAFKWGSMISGRLHDVVHTVLFPTFSRIQNDYDKLKRSYLKILEYITFVSVISNLTLVVCSEGFLFYVLGRGTPKWLPALLPFQIMLLYGMIRAFLEPIGNVILALGESKLLFKSNLIAGAIEVIFLYPVIKMFGISGVAILITLSYSLQYFIYFPFLKKALEFEYSDIWCFVKPTILSIAFVAVIISISNRFMDASFSAFIQKAFLSLIGYALFYNAITKWKLIKETRSIINSIKMA